MKSVVPFLWYDTEAGAAAELYTSAFPGSRVLSRQKIADTPSGDAWLIQTELAGRPFTLISAGPQFRFTPAVSFMVRCGSAAEVDRLHAVLGAGGGELMALGAYPWSPRYAWISDRFGLNWQLFLDPDRGAGAGTDGETIVPTLMYTGANAGKAEEALRFYAGLFPGSSVGELSRYGEGAAPNAPGTLSHGAFNLAGGAFAAMDSGLDHGFGFTEAISFVVNCDDQAEVDRYWDALSAVPEAEACGWLKDRYGLSWQVVPRALDELMDAADEAGKGRITRAFLAMKKFDIAGLERAARGAPSLVDDPRE